nr:unnamed protein product [Spirometra erinaceieuropaei]
MDQANEVLRVILLGLSDYADPVNLIATVESILKQTGESDETAHLIRQQVNSLVMTHKPRAIITRAEQSALRALRTDTSIVILPADKGRSTVVLDKTDYVQKANALLEDRQAYLSCGEESTKKLVTQLDKTIADMQSNKAISKSVRLAIKPTDAAPPQFYGLPKNAEILGRGNDRITRETIEAWHTGANSINRSVALPEASQTLRTQLSEQKSRVRLRQDRNPLTAESMWNTRAAVLQPESDEGAIVTTAASSTYLAGVRTNDRSNADGPDEGAILTATHAAEIFGVLMRSHLNPGMPAWTPWMKKDATEATDDGQLS